LIPLIDGLLGDRATGHEWIDDNDTVSDLLARNLAEIRRINRWLGGYALSLRALDTLVADQQSRRDELKVLDVGTGSADFPEAFDKWFAARGLRGRVIAVDLSVPVLELAARRLRRSPLQNSLAVADGLALPFADRAFDVAHCSFLLHHLEPDAAVDLLREMARVASRAIVVNDLTRGITGYLGSLVACRLLSTNPLTRHDGPLSVLRAYTRSELLDLARNAHLGRVRIRGCLGYRMTMTADVR